LGESGHPYHDSTANNNVSTSTTTDPTQATGKIGKGQTFTTTKQILIANSTSLNPTTALTLQAFAYPTANAVNYDIINKSYTSVSGPYVQYAIKWDGTNQFDLVNATGGSQWNDLYSATTGRAINNWYGVVGAFAGTSKHMYVNGSPDGSSTFSSYSIPTYNTSLGIGLYPLSSSGAFPGTIDEVRVWPVALSANYVAGDYNCQASTSLITVGTPKAAWLVTATIAATVAKPTVTLTAVPFNFPIATAQITATVARPASQLSAVPFTRSISAFADGDRLELLVGS
jgi:hypothetical protein